MLAGYRALLSGKVGRDLRTVVGALEINGSIGGDVIIDIGEQGTGFTGLPGFFAPPGVGEVAQPGLRISDEAEIGGVLTYTSPSEQDSAIDIAPEGGVVYQTPIPEEIPKAEKPLSIEVRIGRWILARPRELVSLLVLGS